LRRASKNAGPTTIRASACSEVTCAPAERQRTDSIFPASGTSHREDRRCRQTRICNERGFHAASENEPRGRSATDRLPAPASPRVKSRHERRAPAITGTMRGWLPHGASCGGGSRSDDRPNCRDNDSAVLRLK
jgi:hypothetical protein